MAFPRLNNISFWLFYYYSLPKILFYAFSALLFLRLLNLGSVLLFNELTQAVIPFLNYSSSGASGSGGGPSGTDGLFPFIPEEPREGPVAPFPVPEPLLPIEPAPVEDTGRFIRATTEDFTIDPDLRRALVLQERISEFFFLELTREGFDITFLEVRGLTDAYLSDIINYHVDTVDPVETRLRKLKYLCDCVQRRPGSTRIYKYIIKEYIERY